MFTEKETPVRVIKRTHNREIAIICFVLLFFSLGVVPVFADTGIETLIGTILTFIIKLIFKAILYVLDYFAMVFIEANMISVSATSDAFGGFILFSDMIRILAVSIASISLLWQFVGILFGPITGSKQTQSVGRVVTKALIYIPLCYWAQPLALNILETFQTVFATIWTDYQNATAAWFGADLFTNLADVFATEWGSEASSVFSEITKTVVTCVLMILIAWNFIKFLLEMIQRFVIMVAYVYLSPLAAACGVGEGTEHIAKQAFLMFFSSGIIYVLNTWCVGVSLYLLSNSSMFVGAKLLSSGAQISNATATVSWALFTYAFMKIIQQIDDIFNAVGATNVKLKGGPLDDFLAVATATRGLRNAVSNMANNYAENGAFSNCKGTEGNPVKPQEKTVKTPTGTDAAKGKTGANPNAPSPAQSKYQTAGAQIKQGIKDRFNQSLPGKIIQGNRKTAENLRERIDSSNGASAQNTLNKATSQPTAAGRAQAMKEMAMGCPEAINHQASKDYVAEKLGLSENQSVSNLVIGKDGSLTASVATKNADGSIGMSQVNDVGSKINAMENARMAGATAAATAGATATGKVLSGTAQTATTTATTNTTGSSSSTTATTTTTTGSTGAAGTVGAAGTPMGKVPDQSMYKSQELTDNHFLETRGRNEAQSKVSFTDNEGNARTATIEKGAQLPDNGGKLSTFTMEDAQGNKSTITAPTTMSASDVGAVMANTASPEMVSSVSAAGGDVNSAKSMFNVNNDVQGSVGAAHEDRATINFTGGTANTEQATVTRGENVPNSDLANFTVSDGNNSYNVQAPADASAYNVASCVAGTPSTDQQKDIMEKGSGFTEAKESLGADNSHGHVFHATSTPEWQNSADTTFTMGSDNGKEQSISMSRTGTGPEKDVWTATNSSGESLGSVSVDAGTGAREVALKTIHEDGDFKSIRETAHFDQTNSSAPVQFTSPTQSNSIGGESASNNVSTTINEPKTEGAPASYSFNYDYSSNGGDFKGNGYMTPTGNTQNGQVEYDFGNEGQSLGKITVSADVSPETISAAIGAKDGAGIEGISELRDKLGIKSAYGDQEQRDMEEYFKGSREEKAEQAREQAEKRQKRDKKTRERARVGENDVE